MSVKYNALLVKKTTNNPIILIHVWSRVALLSHKAALLQCPWRAASVWQVKPSSLINPAAGPIVRAEETAFRMEVERPKIASIKELSLSLFLLLHLLWVKHTRSLPLPALILPFSYSRGVTSEKGQDSPVRLIGTAHAQQSCRSKLPDLNAFNHTGR